MSKSMVRVGLLSLLFLAAAATVWAQSGIRVMSSGGIKYLATPQGKTLYYFALGVKGKPACKGPCAKFWPPFHAASISPPTGLKASDFSTVTRPDGSLQTTYDGWPLYTFAGDRKAGETKGEGFRGTWFVAAVPFYTIALGDSSRAGGTYLVNAQGKTLYYLTKDKADKSICTGGCAKFWPPFDVTKLVLPSALKSSNFTVMTRASGARQVAYKGHPLYYFSGDRARGQLGGLGFRKVWYTADPKKLKAIAADPPKGSSGGSAASGSGW